MLQSAAMRAGADDPDGASGLYMAAFQVGIMAGSFVGGLFYEHGMLMMLAASAVLIGLGAAGMTIERQLFDVPTADQP
jgi:predicted MFS family arabinose efflux permease